MNRFLHLLVAIQLLIGLPQPCAANGLTNYTLDASRCPGWTVHRFGDRTEFEAGKDRIVVHCGPLDDSEDLLSLDPHWTKTRTFHSALLTSRDEWKDYTGPGGAQRRYFTALFDFRRVDGCLECGRRAFEARCATFEALVGSVQFASGEPPPESCLVSTHDLDFAIPLPRGTRVEWLLSLGPPQLSLASAVIEGIMAYGLAWVTAESVGSGPAARVPNTEKGPDAASPPIAPGGKTETPSGEKAGAAATGAPAQSLPVAGTRPLTDLERDDAWKLIETISRGIRHVQSAAFASGRTRGDRLSAGANSGSAFSYRQGASDYDAWVRGIGGKVLYRRVGGESDRNGWADLLYSVGERDRAILGVRLWEADSVQHWTAFIIHGDPEGGLEEIASTLTALLEKEQKGERDTPSGSDAHPPKTIEAP